MTKTNFKLAALALCALFVAPQITQAESSYYVGGNLGVSRTAAKYNGFSMDGYGADGVLYYAGRDKPYNINSSKSSFNPAFDLFTGFGYLMNSNFYLGLELYAGLDFNQKTAYNGYSSDATKSFPVIKVKRNGFIGLAGRVGYMVAKTALVYARFAAEGSRWNAESDLSAAALIPGLPQAEYNLTEAKKSKQASRVNFSTGLGADYFLNKNLFMRAEANYLFGPSIQFIQNKDAYTSMRGIYLNHKVKVNQSMFKLGLGYKF